MRKFALITSSNMELGLFVLVISQLLSYFRMKLMAMVPYSELKQWFCDGELKSLK